MTRIEIATQIFCSGKANEISYAWQLAGELIVLDKEINHNDEDIKIIQDPTSESINNLKIINLKQRTAERTQQLIDLGFEADENLIFTKGEVSISPKLIEEYTNDEWNRFVVSCGMKATFHEIKQYEPTEKTPEELMQLMRNQPLQFVPNDFFKDNPYIEFEMPNTTLRLYRMDNQNQAESDLQVTKKTEPKYIMTHSENKEFELGITIFKK